MKFIINLYYALRVVVTPNCWTRNYNTSKELDGLINDMLDSGANIEIIDEYTTKLGGVILWTSNFPYAYGRIDSTASRVFRNLRSLKGLPNRITVFRLKAAVDAAYTKHINQLGKGTQNEFSISD